MASILDKLVVKNSNVNDDDVVIEDSSGRSIPIFKNDIPELVTALMIFYNQSRTDVDRSKMNEIDISRYKMTRKNDDYIKEILNNPNSVSPESFLRDEGPLKNEDESQIKWTDSDDVWEDSDYEWFVEDEEEWEDSNCEWEDSGC